MNIGRNISVTDHRIEFILGYFKPPDLDFDDLKDLFKAERVDFDLNLKSTVTDIPLRNCTEENKDKINMDLGDYQTSFNMLCLDDQNGDAYISGQDFMSNSSSSNLVFGTKSVRCGDKDDPKECEWQRKLL